VLSLGKKQGYNSRSKSRSRRKNLFSCNMDESLEFTPVEVSKKFWTDALECCEQRYMVQVATPSAGKNPFHVSKICTSKLQFSWKKRCVCVHLLADTWFYNSVNQPKPIFCNLLSSVAHPNLLDTWWQTTNCRLTKRGHKTIHGHKYVSTYKHLSYKNRHMKTKHYTCWIKLSMMNQCV
jgi:hypothetical protein